MSVSLTILDADPAEADRLCRKLRTELLSLAVNRVDLVSDTDVPPGAKADAGTITTIVVTLSGSPVLVQLVGLLRDWVNRANNRKILVKDGDRVLELTGVTDDTGIIETFLNPPREDT